MSSTDQKPVKQLYQSNQHGVLNKLENGVLDMQPFSVYYHLNEELLFKDDDSLKKFNFEDKNVLIIGVGPSQFNRYQVILSLKKIKLKRFMYLRPSRDSWADHLFDDFIEVENEDLNDKENTRKAIEEYQLKNQFKFDAIFTFHETGVLMTSYLACCFGLPAIPFEFAKSIKNKYEMRKICQSLGVNSVRNFLIKHENIKSFTSSIDGNKKELESPDLTVKIDFPVIAKNPFGCEKDFVLKCNNTKEFYEALEYYHKNFENSDLLVEEYYDGYEIDVDILIQDNRIKFLQISDNLTPKEPHFYEEGGISPSLQLSSEEIAATEKLFEEWVSVMNFQNAILHFEARCRPQSIYKKRTVDENLNIIDKDYFIMPIEINLRIGGDEIWSYVKATTGVDLIQEYLKICLGFELDEIELRKKKMNPMGQCLSYHFFPFRDAIVDSFKIDVNKLNNTKEVVEVCIYISKGEVITRSSCLGWVVVRENYKCGVEKLQIKLNEILNCFDYVLKDK